MGIVNVGCTTDTTPTKPETFVPLPSAAPGAQGSTPKSGSKNSSKAAAATTPES